MWVTVLGLNELGPRLRKDYRRGEGDPHLTEQPSFVTAPDPS